MISKSVAVVGCTGVVGNAMLALLQQRNFPVGELRLMASSRSAGRIMPTAWGDIEVEDLDRANPTGIDIALFSAGGDRSRVYAPRFAEAGAVIVDNSSAFRMEQGVPLVVAGVNDEDATDHSGIIANPNCTTMVLAMAVAPLHRAARLQSMVATSYQSVSGSGRAGIEELVNQVEVLGKDIDLLREGGWSDPGSDVYARPIGWNVLPLAGSETEQGYTDEEWKLVNESRKILHSPDLAVEPSCVRVPVVTGHGINASMWFDRSMGTDEANELLAASPGVELWDETVPTPLDSAGKDATLVGRVRETLGRPGGITLWAVGDNLRKGAALNAVQIAEML